MDSTLTLAQQMADDNGPLIFINSFVFPPKDLDRVLEVWTRDAR
jgi:hypothetical protein